MMTRRSIGAVAAGFLCFPLLEFLLGQIARAVWPAYALAYPARSFTFSMLVFRLGVGAAITVASGALTARLATRGQHAEYWLGFALLAAATVWHLHIWPRYPVWYHLIFLGYLVPLTVLGGARLGKSR